MFKKTYKTCAAFETESFFSLVNNDLTCCLRFLGCLALSLCMEDIGGVSLAVVVGKVPEVQVDFYKNAINFHNLSHKITYYCRGLGTRRPMGRLAHLNFLLKETKRF